jgi:hypothetical protein
MEADPIADFEILNAGADRFDDAGDFMPERKWQSIHRRNSRSIMRVRMANASGANANQNIRGTAIRQFDPLLFQRRTDCGKTNSFHLTAALQRALS